MKNLAIIFSLTMFTGIAYAQHHSDPTYSVHNYKQPQKAHEARLNNYDHLQYLDYEGIKGTGHRNYKAQHLSAEIHEGGLLSTAPVERHVNSIHSSGNYKRQF